MKYQQRLIEHLIDYKHTVLGIREPGVFRYRGKLLKMDHILPRDQQWANLLEPARSLAVAYLEANKTLRLHRYFHHLNSSQAFAFNLFFPFFATGSSGSNALLRAFDQPSTLAWWEPEAVPDPDEATNLDARWQLADGTTVLCEVKLSEADFGKARADDKHRKKLQTIYSPRLTGSRRAIGGQSSGRGHWSMLKVLPEARLSLCLTHPQSLGCSFPVRISTRSYGSPGRHRGTQSTLACIS